MKNLYLDKFEGIWELVDYNPFDNCNWKLISSNKHHEKSRTVRGSYQNNATMLEEFAPMIHVTTGDVYEFDLLIAGSKVWIDGTWMKGNGLSHLAEKTVFDYAGVVSQTNCTNPDEVHVQIEIIVPYDKIIRPL